MGGRIQCFSFAGMPLDSRNCIFNTCHAVLLVFICVLPQQAAEPLWTFLDFLTYGHMIDNVVLLVTGALHERGVHVSLI